MSKNSKGHVKNSKLYIVNYWITKLRFYVHELDEILMCGA